MASCTFLTLGIIMLIVASIFTALVTAPADKKVHSPTFKAYKDFCEYGSKYCYEVCTNGPFVCFDKCPEESAYVVNATSPFYPKTNCARFFHVREFCAALESCSRCNRMVAERTNFACDQGPSKKMKDVANGSLAGTILMFILGAALVVAAF